MSLEIQFKNNKFMALVFAGIIATVAHDVVMYSDTAYTGYQTDVPLFLGYQVLGESQYDRPVGYVLHYGTGIVMALLFGYVAFPISRKIVSWPIWILAVIFTTIELITALWLVQFPANGWGIAGLEYQAEIPLMTFTRHTVFGLTLGVLVSKWFKSDSDKSNEKIKKKIGGAEWSI